MSFVLEFLARSSWGVVPLHPILGLLVLVATVGIAWFVATHLNRFFAPEDRRRASWRDERGQGLVEVLLAVFLILVILFVLFRLV